MRKTRKVLILFLLVLSFVTTVGSFAYWASYVEGTQEQAVGTLTVGSAEGVDTAFRINNILSSGGHLVPAHQVLNSAEDDAVGVVHLSYDLKWYEAELVSQLSGSTTTTGDIRVTHNVVIYQDDQVVPYIGNESVYALLHVVYNESNPSVMTLDAEPETFIFSVTMDEPANQAQYDIISKSEIEIQLSFKISDSTVVTVDDGPSQAPIKEIYTITYYDINNNVLYSEDVQEGNGLTSVEVPLAPTIEGYSFTGWSEQLPEVMPTHDINVYPNYYQNTYTITFEENEGTEVEDITESYGTPIIEPDTIKEGYMFTGWYNEVTLESTSTIDVMPAYNVTYYAGWTADIDTITTTIQNHSFENIELCSGTESANIERIVTELLNDPFITVDYVTAHGDGTFTIDLTQTYNDTTNSITIFATFAMCDVYPMNLLAEAQEEIEELISSGLFDDIKVSNLNSRSKTAGIEGRLQLLRDNYNMDIEVVYDDSVKDNGSPYTDTTGMTGTCMGMKLTITLTYNDVTVVRTFDVVAGFVQSKLPDTYEIPDTFTPY